MPMPLCHILRARLRQQGKGDKSTLPVRDNSTLRLQDAADVSGVMVQRRPCLAAWTRAPTLAHVARTRSSSSESKNSSFKQAVVS